MNYLIRSSLGDFLRKEDLRKDIDPLLQAIDSRMGGGVGITQNRWFIDSIHGDDRKSGVSPSAALKTLAALDDRFGQGIIHQPTQVFLFGDFSDQILSIRSASALDPVTGLPWPLVITGMPTEVLLTGVITVTANQAIPSPAPPRLTDVAVANWATAGPGGSSLIGKRLRITQAPNDPLDVGRTVWLVRDEGGGDVSTSFPSAVINVLDSGFPASNTSGLLSPPYTYVVEELLEIQGLSYCPVRPARFVVQDIRSPGPTLLQANGGFYYDVVVFVNGQPGACIVNSFPLASGCWLTDAQILGTGAILQACFVDGPIQNSTHQLFLATNTMAIGSALYQTNAFASSPSFCGLLGGGASCFDAPGAAVEISTGSSMHAFGSLFGGTLYGNGNGVGVSVKPNSSFSYDLVKSTLPTITGTVEVQVGTVATTWAAIDATDGLIELTPPSLARVIKG